MENYREYFKELMMNGKVVDVIANGDLNVENCIKELDELGYRIMKISN